MSALLMGQVFGLAVDEDLKLTLLALADHADDDGTSVRPSIARIAWKIGSGDRNANSEYKNHRTVQRHFKTLIGLKALIPIRKAAQHRPTEYRLDLSVLPSKSPFVASGDTFHQPEPAVRGDNFRGDNLPPLEDQENSGVTNDDSGVTNTSSGVTPDCHPNHQLNHQLNHQEGESAEPHLPQADEPPIEFVTPAPIPRRAAAEVKVEVRNILSDPALGKGGAQEKSERYGMAMAIALACGISPTPECFSAAANLYKQRPTRPDGSKVPTTEIIDWLTATFPPGGKKIPKPSFAPSDVRTYFARIVAPPARPAPEPERVTAAAPAVTQDYAPDFDIEEYRRRRERSMGKRGWNTSHG